RLFLQDERRHLQQHQKDDPDEVRPQVNDITPPRNGSPLRGFFSAPLLLWQMMALRFLHLAG
ncbi:MAG: hypothetical protein PHD87_04520, partial [Candidatus Cloacimonetes bacterium]|nr:hypothetical protein [Candidatus Cloacimonadota bacterium]